MKIETTLSCGDLAWVFDGAFVRQRTVGQVQVVYTHSAGIGDGLMEGSIISNGGENYAPMPPKMVEKYMCVETGIDCGTVYTLGETIFATEAECRVGCAARLKEVEKQKQEREAWQRQRDAERLHSLQRELAELRRKGVKA